MQTLKKIIEAIRIPGRNAESNCTSNIRNKLTVDSEGKVVDLSNFGNEQKLYGHRQKELHIRIVLWLINSFPHEYRYCYTSIIVLSN